jgi:hypothetical protein
MSVISAQMAHAFSVHGPVEESSDKAITTRPSSSANFYVDSEDKSRLEGSGNFLINKGQSLFNGFFNRIAVGEVGLDWGIPNIAEWWGNNTLTIVNSGTGTTIGPVTLPDGFYTAVQCLQQAAALINAEAITLGNALRLEVEFTGTDVKLVNTGVGVDPFYVVWVDGYDPPYALARQLFATAQLAGLTVQNTEITCFAPRILGTTYIDIVSPQLTYNQALKDSTTDNFRFDVLYRWYFADDNVPLPLEKMPFVYAANAPAPAVQMLTETNLPILQGYTPFVKRRAIPYPKQIRWDAKQPIGQVGFQVYDDRGRIVSTSNFPFDLKTGYGGANFQFQLQLLLSEN